MVAITAQKACGITQAVNMMFAFGASPHASVFRPPFPPFSFFRALFSNAPFPLTSQACSSSPRR